MNTKYEKLFETLELPNGTTLRNRFVLAPMTHTLSNDDGTASDVELDYMESRSKDVGLAITAATYVNDDGKAFPGEPSISKEEDLEGLSELARRMKKVAQKQSFKSITVVRKAYLNGYLMVTLKRQVLFQL